MLRKFISIIINILSFSSLIFFAFIKPIDRTPYQETSHYKKWKKQLNDLNFEISSDSIQVGFSKINISPPYSIPLAGYGKRKGQKFTDVHDSTFVRVISIKNSKESLFLVSADLLIIPPNVTVYLSDLLKNTPYTLKNIHLNAVHTHNGPGAWGEKLTGRLFAGPFDEKIPVFLAEKIFEAILLSTKNLEKARVFYSEIDDNEHIKNRLNIKDGVVDPEIRGLKFITENKKTIHLLTYGAHSTVLNSSTLSLSADYPGALNDSIEKKTNGFSVFMAGAVGSQAPVEIGNNDWEEVNNQANGVFSYVKKLNWIVTSSELSTHYFEIPLNAPAARISKNLALRSWVFKLLFGDYPAFIKYTRIGNNLIIGMPCDFSGELMKDLDNYASDKGFNLIVTSFNGSYIGYITHDRLFDVDLYETFTMSWFGYQNGGYFSEIVKDLIDKSKKRPT